MATTATTPIAAAGTAATARGGTAAATNATKAAPLVARKLGKSFGSRIVLSDLDLTLAQAAVRPEPAPPTAHPIVPAPLAPEAEPSPWTSSSPSQASPSEMSPSSPTTPSRRPIVRIPSSVQGVRTVDGATGELTSVQFVDEDFDGIDSPRWRALHNSPGHSGHSDHSGRPGYSGYSDDAGRPPRLDSPYGSTTAAEPEPPMAPTPDEVAARQAWPGAPTVRSASAPRRGPNRAVLIVLVLLVVAVVAVLLWFFFLRDSGSSAAPPPAPRLTELSTLPALPVLSALPAPVLL